MKNESAFSGLEAAIVLIAFVVVAAVFSYVMLGAGFFATQKSQEVTYSGIKQSTSNIVLDGQLYGDASDITSLTLYLSIPEGGQPQKLSDVDYLWTLNGGAVTIVTGTDAGSVGLLQPGDRAKITIALVAANRPGPGSSFTLEVKPKVGASSLISKSLGSGYAGGVIV
ncbi:archaellin/type IV pilin N-terminal domain-containing protein [Methanospirillum lacunae]|uniref:Flagellin n=1 Tax=Methanospirillum lacunae TaxID=668570 RepID=A0A2V2N2Q2_9EURY|nr:flagellin [Methanospirillum lacunae]PWR72830.1 flagellin [Methanospirillum lacunae]